MWNFYWEFRDFGRDNDATVLKDCIVTATRQLHEQMYLVRHLNERNAETERLLLAALEKSRYSEK
jgi:hypothetical protein